MSPPKVTEIIATKEATFDSDARVAVFVGDVVVTDPHFNLKCDKLTVHMQKEGSGMERAIAEGNVEITHDSEEGKDGKPTRSIGRCLKAVYEPTTGLITLTGWPEIQQGFNLHKATEFSTSMVLNREGKMKTYGRSKTLIQDPGQSGTQP